MESQEKNKGELSSFFNSETVGIVCGCGKLYVTICHDSKRRFKRVFIPRNTKFHCPVTTRDALSRLATLGGRRNLRQTIRDLKGEKFSHHCDKYHIGAKAASCFDAVSKALDTWRKTSKSIQMKNSHKKRKENAKEKEKS